MVSAPVSAQSHAEVQASPCFGPASTLASMQSAADLQCPCDHHEKPSSEASSRSAVTITHNQHVRYKAFVHPVTRGEHRDRSLLTKRIRRTTPTYRVLDVGRYLLILHKHTDGIFITVRSSREKSRQLRLFGRGHCSCLCDDQRKRSISVARDGCTVSEAQTEVYGYDWKSFTDLTAAGAGVKLEQNRLLQYPIRIGFQFPEILISAALLF